MNCLSLTFFFHFILFRVALGLSQTNLPCQIQKPLGQSALKGCPEGTLYVSNTDAHANFTSVQKAIDSLPETGKAIILIGEGEYYEMLNVARSAPLTLLGQLNSDTDATPGGNASQRNLVYIWSDLHADQQLSDEATATLTVFPSYGSSFGNVDFKVYNIDFENRAADYSIAPALVTSFTYANVSFYGCTFASYQDTWYTGYEANSYVVDSIIYGQTDYLYGFGTAWFQSVTLANRGCGGAITAWAGTPDSKRGVYVADSYIIRSPDANATTVTAQSCYLGRPWNAYATAVFLRNDMDDSIRPAGFRSWNGKSLVPESTFYAEYDSHGLGGDMSARVKQTHILSESQGESYTLETVFGGWPRWVDAGYQF